MRPFVFLVTVLLAACAPANDAVDVASQKAVDGYEVLKFGVSMNDAIASTAPYSFNPASISDCRADLPVRGCLLLPNDNVTPFTSHEGIPFALGLAFNRFDRLTDIHLEFVRDTLDDPSQAVSNEECLSVHERTLDWLVDEYGEFSISKSMREQDGVAHAETSGGNSYGIHRNADSFLASAERNLAGNRAISLISSYIVIGDDLECDIDAKLSDDSEIERWSLSPEQAATLEELRR